MIILTLRTDKPEAEIGIFDGTVRVGYEVWEAHRKLAETIHIKIKELLESHDTDLGGLQGIVFYKGPGSFTGLRIGASVANTLAHELQLPIVGATGERWLDAGITRLLAGENDEIALPEYGAPVHITQQKK